MTAHYQEQGFPQHGNHEQATKTKPAISRQTNQAGHDEQSDHPHNRKKLPTKQHGPSFLLHARHGNARNVKLPNPRTHMSAGIDQTTKDTKKIHH